MNILFDNVRASSEKESARVRQCYTCAGRIAKGEIYTNHQFRYDGRIIIISFHEKCFAKSR